MIDLPYAKVPAIDRHLEPAINAIQKPQKFFLIVFLRVGHLESNDHTSKIPLKTVNITISFHFRLHLNVPIFEYGTYFSKVNISIDKYIKYFYNINRASPFSILEDNMDRTPVYLIFFTGFLLGVGFMVELKGLNHYTTILVLNYMTIKPILHEIWLFCVRFSFLVFLLYTCFKALEDFFSGGMTTMKRPPG